MSIFRYAKLKMVLLIGSELFNRNLSIFYPTLFLNFVIAPKFDACAQIHILSTAVNGGEPPYIVHLLSTH